MQIREVLRTYSFKNQTDTNKYQYKCCNVTLNRTVDEEFWNEAHIPTKRYYHISSQFQKCLDVWRKMKKYQYRRTDGLRIERELKCTALFDIVPNDVMSLIKIQE